MHPKKIINSIIVFLLDLSSFRLKLFSTKSDFKDISDETPIHKDNYFTKRMIKLMLNSNGFVITTSSHDTILQQREKDPPHQILLYLN